MPLDLEPSRTNPRVPGIVLSVVIPTLNAADTLCATLADVASADEVIVVDGGSVDGSDRLARSFGARLLSSAPGRGRQLDLGARAARGAWMLFLHADTRLPPDWRADVERYISRSRSHRRAAAFRFALDDPSWRARLLEQLVGLRVRLLALPYGDQGLLIHRDLYAATGGFHPLPLMEDVDLVRRLGRRRLTRLKTPARTSARRWRRDGWLARSLRNLTCLTLYAAGVPVHRIVRLYER